GTTRYLSGGRARRVCRHRRAIGVWKIKPDEGRHGIVATIFRKREGQWKNRHCATQLFWHGFSESNPFALAVNACQRDAASRDREPTQLAAVSKSSRV